MGRGAGQHQAVEGAPLHVVVAAGVPAVLVGVRARWLAVGSRSAPGAGVLVVNGVVAAGGEEQGDGEQQTAAARSSWGPPPGSLWGSAGRRRPGAGFRGGLPRRALSSRRPPFPGALRCAPFGSPCNCIPSTPTTPSCAGRRVEAEEIGRGHRLQLGPLLPAVRRSRREALRVLDHAGLAGRGDPAGGDRPPGHLQLLPQPALPGRHGPHRGSHLGRPADPGHGQRVVPAGLRRIRLRVRHPGEPPAPPGGQPAGHQGAPGQGEPSACCAGSRSSSAGAERR